MRALAAFDAKRIAHKRLSFRYEFLIVGALCCAWGIVIYFVLPDSPVTSQWLTREERLMAVARLRKNQTGIDNKQFKWYQAKEAFLKDPKTYLFFFLGVVGNIPNGGISNVGLRVLRTSCGLIGLSTLQFSTLILNGLGFDVLETSLLGIPQGALVCIYIGLGYVHRTSPEALFNSLEAPTSTTGFPRTVEP